MVKLQNSLKIIPNLIKRMGFKRGLLYILYTLKIKKLNQNIIHQTKSGINIPLVDKRIFLYYNKYNESSIIDFVDNSREFGTFINIGSAYGEYLFFSAINPNITKIYGFEPIPKSFNIINQVLEINQKLAKKIKIQNIALGDFTGTTKFYLDKLSLTDSSLSPSTQSEEIEVKIAKLDDLELDIKGNVLLLIDVEGFEIEVLQGAKNLLNKLKPIIIMEVWKRNVPTYKEMIPNFGYKCDHVWTSRRATTEYWKLIPKH